MASKPEPRPGWLKRNLLPLLTLIIVIGISIGLFLFFGRNPERVKQLKDYGYLGAFLVSLIGNGSILLPGLVLPILSGLGIVFYPQVGVIGPIGIGLAGGAGAALGEMVGYLAGYSARRVAEKSKLYIRVVSWVKRWGGLTIFIFALVPLFFDVVGLAAGVLRFPIWKFLLLCWLGRTILYVGAILAVAWGWESVLRFFS